MISMCLALGGMLGTPACNAPSAPAREFVAVEAATYVSCGLQRDGVVRCWGGGAYGALGDGMETVATLAQVVPLPQPATAIAAGENFACAVLADTTVYCWGKNDSGQLGQGRIAESGVPAPVSGLPPGVTLLTAGREHACAAAAGTTYCWGRGDSGQLGDGHARRIQPIASPVLGPRGATALTAGYDHTCAIVASEAWCWGGNGSRQLGDGSNTQRNQPVPMTDVSGARAIAAGLHSTCVLRTEGGVICLGPPDSGAQGIDRRTSPALLENVRGLPSGVVALSAGVRRACARTDAGELYCWGENAGAIGDGARRDRWTAVRVAMPEAASAIDTGTAHTCAVGASSQVYCWGTNYSGELGQGDRSADPRPALASTAVAPPVRLALGYWHGCALGGDGAVECWGDNRGGEVGDGSFLQRSHPVPVAGLFSSLDGYLFTCGATREGAGQCWGELPGGDVERDNLVGVPTTIDGLERDVQSMQVGSSSACALMRDGSVRCFGHNYNGELGEGVTGARLRAEPVRNLSGVLQLAGGLAMCARQANGLRCWGSNASGMLGAVTHENFSARPLRVVLPEMPTDVDVGHFHACAIVRGGGVHCWGANESGQLGNGSTQSSRVPTTVRGLPRAAVDVVASSGTCILDVAGEVWCWGWRHGETPALPRRSLAARTLPQRIEGLPPDIVSLSMGSGHTCASSMAGHVYCWGSDEYGALGRDGRNNALPQPVLRTDEAALSPQAVRAARTNALSAGRIGRR